MAAALADLPRLRRMVGGASDVSSAELLARCAETEAGYITADSVVESAVVTFRRVAIDLLTEELATMRLRVDTSDRDAEKKYSQATKQIRELISDYRAQLPVRTCQVVRSDV